MARRHLLPHRQHLISQGDGVAWATEDFAAQALKARPKRAESGTVAGPRECLMLPNPGVFALVAGIGLE